MSELLKRIITSFFLLILLFSMYFNKFILIISLLLLSVIIWIEYNNLIIRAFKNKKKILRFFLRIFIFINILAFVTIIWLSFSPYENNELKTWMLYILSICIMTDIGGLTFGKIFKGKKLTKISPNKTISGSIGSFFFSIILMLFFYSYINSNELFKIIILTIIVSLISQLGDLFISFLKRKAKIKDTSDILPGHGGLLDRLDGILLGVPFGYLIIKLMI